MRRAVRCLLATFSLLRRSQPQERALEYDAAETAAWWEMLEGAERVS